MRMNVLMCEYSREEDVARQGLARSVSEVQEMQEDPHTW